MYITVQEAMQLKKFKKFNLLAGESGLNNKIEKISILDYEIVDQVENQFFKNEFTLSSLFGARDNASLILKSIKYLIANGVTGLAIKNVYYKELPEEVLTFADDNRFPIFMFDSSVFFEDVITDVRDLLRDLEKGKQLEYKIDSLLRNPSTDNQNIELFYEIAGFNNLPYQVLCITEREKQSKSRLLTILESSRNLKLDAIKGVIKYYNGVLIIYSTEQFNPKLFNVDLSNILIHPECFYIGKSRFYQNRKNLKEAVQQALWASKVAEIEHIKEMCYEDIGTYKLIIPYAEDERFRKFAKDILTPIIQYDKKHGTELLETIGIFIKNEADIAKTADEIHQHNNTIRYRISKIKKILDMESADSSFYEQISIALKVIKLKGLDF
ncbi:MAG: PucR family transcriptional regulator ligand-binding domain-containing protein [Clostridia bacterium]|nr:PucR family transcriptional regulator ligand-binding domain-containing protein [Clostridia bacterium]